MFLFCPTPASTPQAPINPIEAPPFDPIAAPTNPTVAAFPIAAPNQSYVICFVYFVLFLFCFTSVCFVLFVLFCLF